MKGRMKRRGTIGNGVAGRKRPQITTYDVGLARDAMAQPPEGDNSSRRAVGRIGGLGVLGRHFIRRRRDLGPSLAQSNGLAHAIKELLLAVIMLPASAVIELEKMCAPALGKGAPFLGDLVECMPG